MRCILKIEIPVEQGNTALGDREFGNKMKKYLSDVKAEAAYFTTVNGCRGGYIILNVADGSEIPALAEPLFLWLKAGIEILPVMTPDDLAKAGPSIAKAVKEWSE